MADAEQLTTILTRLEKTRACDLESQTLEIKSWGKDPKDLAGEISEAAICLANSEGGIVIVGLDDKAYGARAVLPRKHSSATAEWARERICSLTKPPISCTVSRFGTILSGLDGTPVGDLLLIEVPRLTHPFGHRTLKGVSLIRANTECRPEFLPAGDDYSAVPIENASFDDLDRAGAGLDKVYYSAIADGFDFPHFQSTANSFAVIVPLRRDMRFADLSGRKQAL